MKKRDSFELYESLSRIDFSISLPFYFSRIMFLIHIQKLRFYRGDMNFLGNTHFTTNLTPGSCAYENAADRAEGFVKCDTLLQVK